MTVVEGIHQITLYILSHTTSEEKAVCLQGAGGGGGGGIVVSKYYTMSGGRPNCFCSDTGHVNFPNFELPKGVGYQTTSALQSDTLYPIQTERTHTKSDISGTQGTVGSTPPCPPDRRRSNVQQRRTCTKSYLNRTHRGR